MITATTNIGRALRARTARVVFMARHDSTSRAARSTEGTPTNEKAAASGETTFLRLRLPLPERTGSDRDEPLCPPGFVDRAYLVFCLVTILQTLPNQIDDSMMTGFDATPSRFVLTDIKEVLGYEPRTTLRS
jgi:hypothetical protein